MARITFVLPSIDKACGGPLTATVGLATALVRAGAEVRIVGTYTGVDPDIDADGLKIIGVPRWPLRPFFFSPGFIPALHTALDGCDLLHLIGLWNFPTTVSAAIARSRHLPYIITPSGMLNDLALRQRRWQKVAYALLVERRNLAYAAALHFLNAEEAQEGQAFGAKSPMFILPNGVNLNAMEKIPSLAEEAPDLASRIQDRQAVLYLGRLHPGKGLHLLIPAFGQILARRPDVHLVVAGPDENGYRQHLLALVKHLRLESSVTFTGLVWGRLKWALLGTSTLFASASAFEGDPVAVKEALAAGLPVLITNRCHLNEIEEEGAGVVVHPTVEDITKGLDFLLSDAVRLQRMGIRGRQFIQQYAWERVAGEMREVYRDILEHTRRSSAWQ